MIRIIRVSQSGGCDYISAVVHIWTPEAGSVEPWRDDAQDGMEVRSDCWHNAGCLKNSSFHKKWPPSQRCRVGDLLGWAIQRRKEQPSICSVPERKTYLPGSLSSNALSSPEAFLTLNWNGT